MESTKKSEEITGVSGSQPVEKSSSAARKSEHEEILKYFLKGKHVVEALIQEIKERPCIWDSNININTKSRFAEWKRVAQTLTYRFGFDGVKPETITQLAYGLRDRWKNIKYSYFNARLNKRTYIHEDMLEFLNPVLEGRNAKKNLNAGSRTGLSAVDFLAPLPGVPSLPQPLSAHGLSNYHPLLGDHSIPLIPRSPPAVSQHPHLWNHSPSSPFSHPYSPGDSSQPPHQLGDTSVRMDLNAGSRTGLSVVDFLAPRPGVPLLPQPLSAHGLFNYHLSLWDHSIPLIPRSPPAVSQHPHLWNHSPSSPFSHPYSPGDSSQPPHHLGDTSVRISNDVASSGQVSKYPSAKHSLSSVDCSPYVPSSSSKYYSAENAYTSKDSSSCGQSSATYNHSVEKTTSTVPLSSCRQISTTNDPTDLQSSSLAYVPLRQVSALNSPPEKQNLISTQMLSREPVSTSQKLNLCVVETSEESEPRCIMTKCKSVEKD